MNGKNILTDLERRQRARAGVLLRECRSMIQRLQAWEKTLQAMLRHGNQASPYRRLAEPAGIDGDHETDDDLTESELAQVDGMLRLDQALDDFSKEQDRVWSEYGRRKQARKDETK